MADTILAKTGFHKSATNDLGWGARLNTGFDTFESRIGLTYAGNPQSHVAGTWFGQTCWDSTNGILYACVGPGDAASTSWAPFDPTPIGTFGVFMRAGLPPGWLVCDGTTLRQADFPDLSQVLPTRLKTGLNFTLPNLNESLALLVGTGVVSAVSGSANTGDGGAFDTGTFQTGVVTATNDPSVGPEIGYQGEYANIRVNGYAAGITGNPSGSGVKVDFMQYVDFIKPQTARVQATAHQHAITPRGITLLAGVKY
jgi:hypothetical protein